MLTYGYQTARASSLYITHLFISQTLTISTPYPIQTQNATKKDRTISYTSISSALQLPYAIAIP